VSLWTSLLLIAVALVAGAAAGALAVWQLRPAEVATGPGVRDEPRLLAEHVVDMVSTHDVDGTFRYVSPVFAGLVGEYPGLLVGKHPRTLAHADDVATIDGIWKRAVSWRGAAVTINWRCRRHNGEYAWLETTARSASREAADLGAVVCASRDITERKQIENALRDSEQRFRSTLETVRLVALGLDNSGNVTFANEALCALTGWSRTELIGENWLEKCGAPDAAGHASLEELATGEFPTTVEYDIVCRDGSRRTIAWDNTILRSPSGEVQGTASLGADVTERRIEDATMKLLQSITHSISAAPDLDAALEQTVSSLCSATGWAYGELWLPTDDLATLTLATVNAAPGVDASALTAAGAALSYSPGQGLPGRAWESGKIEWLDDLGESQSLATVRRQAAAGAGFKTAVAIPVFSGAEIVAVLCFFMDRPVHTDDRHTRMVSVVANQAGSLIDRRRSQRRYEAALESARDAAESASRAKSEFLSRMSHELRTPLNSVIGFANVMRKNRGGRLMAEDLDFLDRIAANGRHLLSLVNNVLDIAKVEAGRITVTKGLVVVDALIKDVVSQLQGQPRAAGVEFRADVPEGMAPLETDGELLRQVLINLAGNSLKFTQTGSVVVSAEVNGDGSPSRLLVTDTGIGIPADRLGAIFDPFEQADETTHKKYGGTGLGLAISKSICDELGFQLTVESTVGKGSVFSVRLARD